MLEPSLGVTRSGETSVGWEASPLEQTDRCLPKRPEGPRARAEAGGKGTVVARQSPRTSWALPAGSGLFLAGLQGGRWEPGSGPAPADAKPTQGESGWYPWGLFKL